MGMSDKVSQIHDVMATPEPKGKFKKGDPEETEEFKKTLKEGLDYVMPQMGKDERRQYEQSKLLALGGTLEKRPHEPYAHVKRKRVQLEQIRQEKLKEDKLLGVSLSANKHRRADIGDSARRRKEEEAKAKKRRKEGDILKLGMGAKESRGMAIIPKKNLRAYR